MGSIKTSEEITITEVTAGEQRYIPKLNVIQTVHGIRDLKNFFEMILAERLNLVRASAPLFVRTNSGLNDDLNGVEKWVEFVGKSGEEMCVVQSLAKWKRFFLGKVCFNPGLGVYTDMNAIRKDEDLSDIHSYYVDQWDWEMVITKEARTQEKLVQTVEIIYSCILDLHNHINKIFPALSKKLPPYITFISSQELEDKYPTCTPKQRERLFAKEHGAAFISQIGKTLKSGEKHDSRAPDYDDWEINGDIIVYHAPMDIALELSSMGIRVDETSMLKQLKLAGNEERLKYEFHDAVVNCKLPYTMGGGIGQSRLAMFFLEKIHIGEVQSSVWPAHTVQSCEKKNILLL